jgi:small-conductance mechanosensitive channel
MMTGDLTAFALAIILVFLLVLLVFVAKTLWSYLQHRIHVWRLRRFHREITTIRETLHRLNRLQWYEELVEELKDLRARGGL